MEYSVSTLKTNTIQAATGTTVSLTTGHKISGAAGSLIASGMPLQVQSTNNNTHLSYGSGDGTGVATGISDFSVVPSEFYVNITALRANSKYLCIFDGNCSVSTDVTLGDGINGFGFLVDPAGGTSWTQFASGSNSSNADNIKFFATRLSPTGGGNDGYVSLALNGNAMFTSSAAAGATLRFAIEYFHYDNANHQTLYINRRPSSSAQAGNSSFQSGLATTLTVWEIAQ
tara:strand:+ start:4 stop:690 length:687 start_codon:yes stop_codon:yes gene_type:complete